MVVSCSFKVVVRSLGSSYPDSLSNIFFIKTSFVVNELYQRLDLNVFLVMI